MLLTTSTKKYGNGSDAYADRVGSIVKIDHSKTDGNAFINEIIKRGKLRNDADLARRLEVAPPVISAIRAKRLPVGATILLRMHEAFDISISELKQLLMNSKENSDDITGMRHRVAGQKTINCES